MRERSTNLLVIGSQRTLAFAINSIACGAAVVVVFYESQALLLLLLSAGSWLQSHVNFITHALCSGESKQSHYLIAYSVDDGYASFQVSRACPEWPQTSKDDDNKRNRVERLLMGRKCKSAAAAARLMCNAFELLCLSSTLELPQL